MVVNDRIKYLRKFKGLSQDAFGEALGITGASISRYESGSREITDSLIKLICQTFSISESWLRTGEGEMEVRPPEDIVDRLAREYHLGVPHVALLRAAARVIQEFPEDVALQLIDQIVADLQAARPDPQAAADAALNQRMQSHMPDRLQDDSSSPKCAQT